MGPLQPNLWVCVCRLHTYAQVELCAKPVLFVLIAESLDDGGSVTMCSLHLFYTALSGQNSALNVLA